MSSGIFTPVLVQQNVIDITDMVTSIGEILELRYSYANDLILLIGTSGVGAVSRSAGTVQGWAGGGGDGGSAPGTVWFPSSYYAWADYVIDSYNQVEVQTNGPPGMFLSGAGPSAPTFQTPGSLAGGGQVPTVDNQCTWVDWGVIQPGGWPGPSKFITFPYVFTDSHGNLQALMYPGAKTFLTGVNEPTFNELVGLYTPDGGPVGVISVQVTDGGSGYTNGKYTGVILVEPNGGGYNATATVVVSGGAITSVTVTNQGYGYLGNSFQCAASFITFIPQTGGTLAQATATCGPVPPPNQGYIGVLSIAVTNGGSGFTSAPVQFWVTLPGNPGYSAQATFYTVVGGGVGAPYNYKIDHVVVNAAGADYLAGAWPFQYASESGGTVTSTHIQAAGSGGTAGQYQIYPVTPPGAPVTLPAALLATVSGGGVTAVSIESGGEGFPLEQFDVLANLPPGMLASMIAGGFPTGATILATATGTVIGTPASLVATCGQYVYNFQQPDAWLCLGVVAPHNYGFTPLDTGLGALGPPDALGNLMLASGVLLSTAAILAPNTAPLIVQTYNFEDWLDPFTAGGRFCWDWTTYTLWVWSASNQAYRLFLSRQHGVGVDVAQVIAWLLAQTDLETFQWDVSEILEQYFVQGVQFGQQSVRESVLVLMQTFLIDAVETNGLIKFVPRNRPPSFAMIEDDIGAETDMNKTEPRIQEVLLSETDTPERISLLYFDVARDYQQALQYEKRISLPYSANLLTYKAVTNSRLEQSYTLPISSDADTMKQQAQLMLYDAWSSRFAYTFKTAIKFLFLDPGDIITLNYKGVNIEIRLTEADRGAGLVLQFKGQSHDYNVYYSVATSTAGGMEGSI